MRKNRRNRNTRRNSARGREEIRDIIGTSGGETLFGRSDRENDIFGLEGNDFLFGQDKRDRILGGPGNDLLTGAGGNDRLLGGDGNDSLLGSNGFFGADRDTLTGGRGRDTFVLGLDSRFTPDPVVLYRGSGFARITDFRAGFDSIELAGEAGDYNLRYVGGSRNGKTEIRFDNGSRRGDLIAVLENTSPGLSLRDSSFVFVD